MHTPLGIHAQSHFAPPPSSRRGDGVHTAERLWDALAGLLIVAGTTLFLLARNGLASMADGTYTLAVGQGSNVQRADYYSAQSTLGLIIICIGVAVGLVAAIRHALRRRAERNGTGA